MIGEEIKIVVYANPYPKGRPRVALRGKFPIIYTPKTTRDAEDEFLSQAIEKRPKTPLEGPLSVRICFFKVKPKSYSKNRVYWTQKPDLDNLVKLVLDALNKVFYVDDSQVVELSCSKKFANIPRTEVIIKKVSRGY